METIYYTITIRRETIEPQSRPERKQERAKSIWEAIGLARIALSLACVLVAVLVAIGFVNANAFTMPEAEPFEVTVKMPDRHIEVAPISTVYPEVERPQTNYGEEYAVPAAATSQKTYMDYRCITAPSSDQWAMQQTAWTDQYGFRRDSETGYYMVAMGTYYAEKCGKAFEITFDQYNTIRVIVGDIKADVHTDELNQHRNGNVVEFIVDTDAIDEDCRLMGDMSWTSATNLHGTPIKITEIYI